MVAGALVMMGSSTAAAAGIAGGLVFVFGGTGAGLAGYKMNTRTAGLTDFQFKQYEEKVTYCWYVCSTSILGSYTCAIFLSFTANIAFSLLLTRTRCLC